MAKFNRYEIYMLLKQTGKWLAIIDLSGAKLNVATADDVQLSIEILKGTTLPYRTKYDGRFDPKG